MALSRARFAPQELCGAPRLTLRVRVRVGVRVRVRDRVWVRVRVEDGRVEGGGLIS